MNAVSPTRSTRTLLALFCWHSAGVATASMSTSESEKTSAELSGFKNDLHAVRCEPAKLRRLPQTGLSEAGGARRPPVYSYGGNADSRHLARCPPSSMMFTTWYPYPPPPWSNEIMGLAGIFCFGL